MDAKSYEYVAVNKIKNQHRSLMLLNARLSELKINRKNKILPMFKENHQNQLFKFKAKECPEIFCSNVVSALTEQLKSQEKEVNTNSFLEYLKFEAHVIDSQMQRIKIFLPMTCNFKLQF